MYVCMYVCIYVCVYIYVTFWALRGAHPQQRNRNRLNYCLKVTCFDVSTISLREAFHCVYVSLVNSSTVLHVHLRKPIIFHTQYTQ